MFELVHAGKTPDESPQSQARRGFSVEIAPFCGRAGFKAAISNLDVLIMVVTASAVLGDNLGYALESVCGGPWIHAPWSALRVS